MTQCQCLTKNGKGPQCSRQVKTGSFCTQHLGCGNPMTGAQKKEPTNMFDLIPDDSVAEICQQMFERGDYRSLDNFIKTDKRAHRICEPLLRRAHEQEQRKKPYPPTLFASDKEFDFDIEGIKTVSELQNFLTTHPEYKMTDSIRDGNHQPLIYHLIDKGDVKLIEYLIQHNPLGADVLSIALSNTMSPLGSCIIDNHNIELAGTLVDLGAPVNQQIHNNYGHIGFNINNVPTKPTNWTTPLAIVRRLARSNDENMLKPEYQTYTPLLNKMIKMVAKH